MSVALSLRTSPRAQVVNALTLAGRGLSRAASAVGARIAGHTRGVAICGLLLTVAGLALSFYLWSGQRFATPPVSFMTGPGPIAAQFPMALAYSVVGAILASRLARNPIGWIFIAIGLTSSFVPAVHLMVAAAGNSFVSPGPLTLVLAWLVSSFHLPLLGALIVIVFITFPDGHPQRRRWWWGGVFAGIGALGVATGLAVDPRGLLWYPQLPNPFAGPGWMTETSDWIQLGGLASVVVGVVITTASMIVRYRSYTPAERRPLQWIAASMGLLVVMGTALMVVRYGLVVDPWIGELVLTSTILAAALLPVAAGIGILRHRLFDIELILNHALVYVPLSALMTGIYAASVALFQRMFVAVTGNTSDFAIVLTTLILASTFTPMRKGLEAFVDRRFKPAGPPMPSPSEAAAAAIAALEAAAVATPEPVVVTPARPQLPVTPDTPGQTDATLQALMDQLERMERRLGDLEARPARRQVAR